MRIKWLDIVKGIGIVLVVLGHCCTNNLNIVTNYICSFHMPLFFLASGITFKRSSFDDQIRKRFYSLALPLIIYTVINYFVVLVSYLLIPSVYRGTVLQIAQLRGQWFLISLLLITLFATFLDNYLEYKALKHKNLIFNSVCFALGGAGFAISYMESGVPDYAITSLVGYFALGILVKDFLLKHSDMPKGKAFAVLAIGVAVLAGIFFIPLDTVQMYRNMYCAPIFFLLKSLMGIVGIFLVSIGIRRCRVLEFLGKNSLVILVTHFSIYQAIDFLYVRFVNRYLEIWSITLTVIVILIASSISIVVNCFFPAFAGRGKRSQHS